MTAITALIRNKEKDDAEALSLIENLIKMREREYEKATADFARDLTALEARRNAIRARIDAGRNYAAWLECLA